MEKENIKKELLDPVDEIVERYSKKTGATKSKIYAAILSAVTLGGVGLSLGKKNNDKPSMSESTQTQVKEELNDLGLPEKQATADINILEQDEIYYVQKLSPQYIELIGKVEPNSLMYYGEPKVAQTNKVEIFYKYYVKGDGEGYVNFRSEPSIEDNNIISKLHRVNTVYLGDETYSDDRYGFRSALCINKDGTIVKGYLSPCTYDNNGQIIEGTERVGIIPESNCIAIPKKNVELYNKKEMEIEKNIVTSDEGIEFRQDSSVTIRCGTISMEKIKENEEGKTPVVTKIPKEQEIDIYALTPELDGPDNSIWRQCEIQYEGEQIVGYALVGKRNIPYRNTVSYITPVNELKNKQHKTK